MLWDGVQLPADRDKVYVQNGSGVSIEVWPHSGGDIDGAGTDNAVIKATGTLVLFIRRNQGTDWTSRIL